MQHEARRLHERVVADRHRRRAGVVGTALEHDRPPRLTGDRRDDSECLSRALEHGPLLDVQLDESVRELRERLAPHRAGLLGTEGDHSDRRVTQTLRDLDSRQHSQHAVVPAPVRNRVEMRTGPDERVAAAPDQVPGFVDLDVQTGLAHPFRGQAVRFVLLRGVTGAVADRRDPLDPLEELHRASVVAYIRPR